MRRITQLQLAVVAAVLLSVTVVGCGRDSVKTYQVDASDAISTSAPPSVANTPMPTAMPNGLPAPDNSGLPKLKYTLPAGWTEKPLTQLRLASFEISEDGKAVDVSVIPLSGAAGGDLANVNRWRGQVGQPLITEEDLQKAAESVTVGTQPANLFDIAGTAPGSGDDERIIGVILHAGDTAWYFKMMGDSALAEKNKTAFIAFLKSVQFDTSAAPAAMDMSQLPAGHPAIPGTAADAPQSTGKPEWTVPAGWQEGELAQFLVARFVIAGNGDATAAVNVSQLDGDGGGLLANVNRWRNQLGQQQITPDDAAKLPAIDASGIRATVADFSGTDGRTGKAARLVGVVLPLNGQTWFYKLMGDPAVVEQQKDAFLKFVQSAKYPAAQ